MFLWNYVYFFTIHVDHVNRQSSCRSFNTYIVQWNKFGTDWEGNIHSLSQTALSSYKKNVGVEILSSETKLRWSREKVVSLGIPTTRWTLTAPIKSLIWELAQDWYVQMYMYTVLEMKILIYWSKWNSWIYFI
jgi:hypothetical protein